MENTSGQSIASVIPPELDRWNWGAFLLNWIWGIGNNTFIALLMFVPGVNIVMLFVLGVKGSKWAWRNKRWEDVDHFKRVQRKWAIWGVVVWIASIGVFAGAFFSIMEGLKHSEAYQLAVTRLQASAEAINALGTPISTGYPWGSIEISGTKGKADFSFSAEGPKSKGTVYLDATKDLGTWKINRLELAIEGRASRINLAGGVGRASLEEGLAAAKRGASALSPLYSERGR
jgi:Cytochrome oxidase complex assembly protein 1